MPSLHELVRRRLELFDSQPRGEVASPNEDYLYDSRKKPTHNLIGCINYVGYARHRCIQLINVVVRLEHSHSFIDSLDIHSTASGPASCSRRMPPTTSTMCRVVWWLSPHGQAGDVITPHR